MYMDDSEIEDKNNDYDHAFHSHSYTLHFKYVYIVFGLLV